VIKIKTVTVYSASKPRLCQSLEGLTRAGGADTIFLMKTLLLSFLYAGVILCAGCSSRQACTPCNQRAFVNSWQMDEKTGDTTPVIQYKDGKGNRCPSGEKQTVCPAAAPAQK